MTFDFSWTPRAKFLLEDVLSTRSLGELRVGASADDIETLLGPAELSAGRLGRKSKIWSRQYGNVAILTAQHRVVAVYMDYEGSRTRMVDAGRLLHWRTTEWIAYAAREGFKVQTLSEHLTLIGDGAQVSIHQPDGNIHVASLVERASP